MCKADTCLSYYDLLSLRVGTQTQFLNSYERLAFVLLQEVSVVCYCHNLSLDLSFMIISCVANQAYPTREQLNWTVIYPPNPVLIIRHFIVFSPADLFIVTEMQICVIGYTRLQDGQKIKYFLNHDILCRGCLF